MIARTGLELGTLPMLMLIVHVSAGCVAILAGAAALSVRKGERLHRRFGTVFFAAMLIMAAFATVLSVLLDPGKIVGAIFTFYLVATAWATVKRKEGHVGTFEKCAFVVAAACAAAELLLGLQASRNPTGRFLGLPAALYYTLGAIVALAAAGDLKMLLRGGITGNSRIARHLWRMCFALFFATGSFRFAFMHGSPILLMLAVAPLVFMIFWLVRIRSPRANSKPDAATA